VTDGGEDGQNVPLMPLLAKARALDAIFAVDGSADTSETYANGTSLVATAQKVELHAHNFTRASSSSFSILSLSLCLS